MYPSSGYLIVEKFLYSLVASLSPLRICSMVGPASIFVIVAFDKLYTFRFDTCQRLSAQSDQGRSSSSSSSRVLSLARLGWAKNPPGLSNLFQFWYTAAYVALKSVRTYGLYLIFDLTLGLVSFQLAMLLHSTC